jgi:hypothetical protein
MIDQPDSEALRVAEELFESFPDKEPLKDFDDFFVGGGCRPGMEEPRAEIGWQLSNVRTVADLKRGAPAEGLVEAEDDLDLFILDKVDVLDAKQYEDLFFAMKKRAFALFGFVDILSSSLGDVPVREKDLVLDDSDHYVIEYLREKITDYFAVSSIATLLAYENMGIHSVKFRQADGCALCKALDGAVYSTGYLVNLLGEGNHVSHGYCACRLEPIIAREVYEGPLSGRLDQPELQVGKRVLRSVPVELAESLGSAATALPDEITSVVFLDMRGHLLKASSSRDREGIVALREGETLYVHNSYVGVHGPVEFLRGYFEEKRVSDAVDVAAGGDDEVFYLKGRKAVFRDGKYWDAVTGERLK